MTAPARQPHPQRCRKLFVNCDGVLSCRAPFADDITKEKCIEGKGECEFREYASHTSPPAPAQEPCRECDFEEHQNQIEEAAKAAREQVTEWLFEQFKEFTKGEYVFGKDLFADWWIERVGFLRTPEGEQSLRAQQQQGVSE